MAAMELFSSLLLLVAVIALFQKKLSFKTEFQWPILAFTAIMLLNCLLSPSLLPLTKRLDELRWIFLYWGLAKSLELIWTTEVEKKALKIWIFALILPTAFGVFQFFTGTDPIRGTTGHLPPSGNVFRATGFFSLCLTYAYSMGISGLSLAWPIAQVKRYYSFAAIALSGIAVLVSLTRGAWLAFGVGLLTLAFFLRKHMSKTQMALVSLAFLIPVMGLVFTDGGYDRILKLINFQSDPAVNERFGLWKAYWQMFIENPIFGVGYGQGAELLTETYQKLGMTQTFVSHAHNDYVQSLAETGLIGTFAFVFLLFFALKKTFDLRKHNYVWAVSLFAGQLYIIIGSLSQANFTDAEVNHFLMFNWALASALLAKAKTPPQPGPQKPNTN